MKKFFTFLMMTLMSFMFAFANTATFTASTTLVSGTENGFNFDAQKNNGSTAPTYNSNGADVRVYAKGSYEITYSAGKITGVIFNISAQGKKRLAPITANNGTVATQTSGDETVEWSGNSSSVKFTVGDKADYGSEGSSKAGQLCFTSVVITYTSESAVAEPAISGTTPFANTTEVTITCSDAEATVYYTTDGTVPTNASTQYTVPFTLNTTTTVKAIAYNGTNYSDVTTKEFTRFPRISTVADLNALADNTEFVFDDEVVCVYQHGQYTYIQDETAATLLYGTLNDDITYEITDVIPNGWQGKKITYSGLPEITTLSGFTAASTIRNLEATELDLSEDISTDDFGKYVVVKNVLISTGTPEPPTPVGTEVTFDFNNGLSDLGLTSPSTGEGKNLEEPITHQGVTLSFTSGGTATRIWNSSGTTTLRVYKNGGSLTFTSSGNNFTSIVFDGTISGTFDVGTMNWNTKTWTGNATAVTVTITTNSTINKITFTLASSSSAPMHAQTVTGNYTLTDVDGNTLNAYPTKLGYTEIPDDLTQRYDAYGVLDFHSGSAQLLPLGFIDGEGTVTSVTDIDDTQVIDIKYYDIMGRESSKPYDGLNIIVLKYQNGKTKTIKVLK